MAERVLVGVSLVAHAAVLAVLTRVEPEPPPPEVVRIEVTTVERPEPPPPTPEPPPPEPEPAPAPQPAAPPPTAAPAPAPSAAPAPDFGFVMGAGAAGGPGGVAVAPPGPQQPRQAAKTLGAPPPAPTCREPETRPRAVDFPKPAYPESERASGVEGKVKVQISLDATGKVVDAVITEGLGPVFDGLALEAARKATFAPATRCGAPVAATFKLSLTFVL
jgi:protein TonB